MRFRDCANNLVNNALIKNINVKKKRRITIFIQILTKSRVFLLNEFISNLDAFTTTSIIDVLCDLATEDRILILTIHQSRFDIFKYFDNILLLTRDDSLVFADKESQMLSHFATLNYECSIVINFVDFVLDFITINLQNFVRKVESKEKIQFLISS